MMIAEPSAFIVDKIVNAEHAKSTSKLGHANGNRVVVRGGQGNASVVAYANRGFERCRWAER